MNMKCRHSREGQLATGSSLAPCSAYGRAIMDGTEIKPVFESLEDCRAQGQAAYGQCFQRDQNPYPKGTALREWWDGGWCEEMHELLGE